jgi:hypothetical protein
VWGGGGQLWKRMRRMLLSSLAFVPPPYSSTLFHKPHEFFAKSLLSTKCKFLILIQLLPEIFLILIMIQRNIILIVKTFLCKIPVILVGFQRNLNILAGFSKNLKYENVMKVRLVRDELFHEYRRTGRHDEGNGGF